MKNGRTPEEFEAVLRRELANAGLAPERFVLQIDHPFPWWLRFEIAGRQFSMGHIYRDGFFCEETTDGRAFDFLANVERPAFGPEERLRSEAFQMVRYGLEHPDFRGAVRPTI